MPLNKKKETRKEQTPPIFYIFCKMNFIKYRMTFLPLFNKGLKLVKESLIVRVRGRLFLCGQVRHGHDWEELRSCLRLYFRCVYCLCWCRTLAGSYLFLGLGSVKEILGISVELGDWNLVVLCSFGMAIFSVSVVSPPFICAKNEWASCEDDSKKYGRMSSCSYWIFCSFVFLFLFFCI